MNIQLAIIEGTNILQGKHIQSAQLDAEILMAKALGKDRKYIILNNNEDITIYGDGLQTRSFQFIDDLVEGLLKMMNSDFEGPVNLGNPVELSMKDLAGKIINLTNSSSDIIYKELPEDDPKRRRPDISLANTKLDWKPIIDLEYGLQKTINYFASN